MILPHDSVFSVQTQHACGTYLLQASPYWCNPALFPFAKDAAIKSDLAVSADQDAYETTSKFVGKGVDKAFIEGLFKEQDFQLFSGLARVEAVNDYLSFSYIPVYAVGAYKLSNPNLPEISAAANKTTEYRLASGLKLFNISDDWEFYSGGALTLYDRDAYEINANALELIVKSVDALLQKDHTQGVNGDIGFSLLHPSNDGLAFSLVGTDIFTPQERSIGQNKPLALEPNYNRVVRVGSGYTFIHSTGSYYLGVQAPFWDYFREFDRYGASAAFIYGIGRLRTFASYSQLLESFGFLFMSSHYQVGIEYTNDKQDNSLELKRRKNVYLFISFNF